MRVGAFKSYRQKIGSKTVCHSQWKPNRKDGVFVSLLSWKFLRFLYYSGEWHKMRIHTGDIWFGTWQSNTQCALPASRWCPSDACRDWPFFLLFYVFFCPGRPEAMLPGGTLAGPFDLQRNYVKPANSVRCKAIFNRLILSSAKWYLPFYVKGNCSPLTWGF